MNKKKFDKNLLRNVLCEEIKEQDEEYPDLILVETGQWIDEGKYQHQQVVYQTLSDGKYWCYWQSKSGSYFSHTEFSWEWEDDEIELDEVHKVTKTIEVWE